MDIPGEVVGLSSVTRVPLERMAGARNTRLAEDIFSKDGAILLPRGSELPSNRTQVTELVRALKEQGCKSVLLERDYDITFAEFESLLQQAEQSVQPLQKELARYTVHQVRDVYRRLAREEETDREIETLVETGQVLTDHVMQSTELVLSLGRVRDWDEYTFVHSLNVALLCGFLAGKMLKADRKAIEQVVVGGLLHDLGKAWVPLEILNKPAPLSDEEFGIIKRHPQWGADAVARSGIDDQAVGHVVRHHHERTDGSGYPDGLGSEDIPMEARIAAVADVFDALTTDRVYKVKVQKSKALSMIITGSGGHFDGEVVRVLLSSLGVYPPGTMVELSDGSVGIVAAANDGNLTCPKVLRRYDASGAVFDPPLWVDTGTAELYVKRRIDDLGKRPIMEV